MGLIELCEKYFNTSNLYEVLELTEKATDKEGKLILCLYRPILQLLVVVISTLFNNGNKYSQVILDIT